MTFNDLDKLLYAADGDIKLMADNAPDFFADSYEFETVTELTDVRLETYYCINDKEGQTIIVLHDNHLKDMELGCVIFDEELKKLKAWVDDEEVERLIKKYKLW